MIIPVPLGAVKETRIVVELDTEILFIVGAFDNVVASIEATDEMDVPLEFVEVAIIVYGVFGVNPDTVIGEDVPVPIKPPGLLVTV